MFFVFSLLLAFSCGRGQVKTDSFLSRLLFAAPDTLLHRVLLAAPKYRVQIIYTRIDRDFQNKPRFTSFSFPSGEAPYFYPASTVKLPLALLSLEKLHTIQRHQPAVNRNTRLSYDSSWPGERALVADSTAENGFPSIAQFIRKAFLISDNDAYNRMYEFVGQQQINRRLHALGYPDTRILRQFMPLNEAENRQTNAVHFLDAAGRTLYDQPAQVNPDSFDFTRPVFVGSAYIDRRDSLVRQPMNFTRHNNIPLSDLQQMLQSVLFPRSVAPERRFAIDSSDRAFLLRYLSQFPSETSWPKYDSTEFYDTYVKFFFEKGGRCLPPGVRVFNKVGWAYGFLTDVSYVVDFQHKVEFMLAATVYANEDGVLNDDRYDLETIGLPFLYSVGQTIYRYELKRKRVHRPDLKAFRINYEKRDSRDRRPSVRVVDN